MKTRMQIAVLALVLSLAGCAGSSSNNLIPERAGLTPSLPELVTSDLDGQEYTLPKDLPSDRAVIVFAFAHEQKESAGKAVETLVGLEKDGAAALYKIPVIDRSNAALRTVIRSGMSAGTGDAAARKRTLPVFVDAAALCDALGITDRNSIWVLAFNRKGEILWRGQGEPNEAQLRELRSALGA